MLKEHQITEHGRKKENVTGLIDKFMGSNIFTTKKSEFNPEMFKQILLIWMVKHNISFIEVENEEFRNLQKYGQTLGAALIPQSGNTIKSWILALFYDNKNNLKHLCLEKGNESRHGRNIQYIFNRHATPALQILEPGGSPINLIFLNCL